jgi:hypothetical protein
MSDDITFPQMQGTGSSVAAFAIGTDGSTLVVVPNGDMVVSFVNMRDEIERLRARVEVLHDALSATHTWLGAALQCPAFQWDADQKQAAQHDYDEARAALEAKP